MASHPCSRVGQRLLLFVMPLMLLTGRPLDAQDTAVVFVHGIQSDGSTWNHAANILQQALRIEPVLPSLDWWKSEGTQAAQLSSYLNAHPATSNPARKMPFVGHSNGGLVSREYMRGGGRLIHVVTVGTPHRGAPLANNWLNYSVPNYALFLLDGIYTPLAYYDSYDTDPPLLLSMAAYLVEPIVWLGWHLDELMCPVAGLCLVWQAGNEALPVVHDLAVGSPATGLLNAGANLTQEAAKASARVGIRTALNPYGALFRLIAGNPNDWLLARDVAVGAYIAAYHYYRDHPDPFLSYDAGLWVYGALHMIDIDANWQGLLGTLVQYQRYFDPETGVAWPQLHALENDGIVPFTSAMYPGGTRNTLMNGEIIHGAQTTSSTVVAALKETLRSDFGIPDRPIHPPPPTYGMQIQGPHAVRPGDSCYWYTSTNLPDPSYEWSVDGIPVGSGPELFYTAQSSFTLSVLAWNGSGGGASASRYVDVDPQNDECLMH